MDRIVAMKILSDELSADEAFVRRFVREARSSGQLNHPNIVRAFDAGKSGKQYYFVREFVDGGTLDERLSQKGRLAPEEAVDIASQVGRGLFIAHQSGLVHRDVTPANILISSDGTAKLTNFGMAKGLYVRGGAEASGISSGERTPDYVSPEEAQGESIDARADMFSLGATLYRMLTGQLPYSGDTPAAVLAARIQTRPALAHEIEPAVPPALAQVIDKMMATSPEDRYADLQHALKELQSVPLKAPHPAKKVPTAVVSKRRPKAAKRKKLVAHKPRGTAQFAVMGGVVMVALTVGGLMLAGGGGESLPDVPPPNPDPARSLPGPSTPPSPSTPITPAIDPLRALEHEAAGFYAAVNGLFSDGRFTEVVRDIDSKGRKYAVTSYATKLDGLRTRAAEALEGKEKRAEDNRTDRQYAQLIALAKSKLGFGDFIAAQKALEDAKKLKRTDEIAELMREAKRGEHLVQARDAEGKGSIPTAIVHYRAALEYRDDPELVARIDKLELTEKHVRLMADGRKAEARGDLAAAVAAYEDALAIVNDSALSRRLKGLKRDLALAQALAAGKEAEAARRYDDTIRHYRRALELESDNALASRVEVLEKRRAYAGILEAARAAEDEGDWATALQQYQKALEVAPGEDRKDITTGITRTRAEIAYGEAMARAREAADAASWSSVKEHAHTALKAKPKDAAAIALYKKAFDAAGPEKSFTNSIGMEFVLIPAGKFTMGRDEGGDKDERPARAVTLPAYYMSVSEVTNAQFEACEPLRKSGRSEFSDLDDSPVVDVSWREAAEFCSWISRREGHAYRLPDEKEWEKAARGTDGRLYPWGNDKPVTGRKPKCNYAPDKSRSAWNKDGFAFAAPVGRFDSGDSPFGIHDMAGNVWEWCKTSGDGPEVVLRGGSFSNDAQAVSATNRAVVRNSFRAPNAGFRVVREVLDWDSTLELLERTR
jgi:formylglycine-generating enzyme required for sulfatase activity/serine/threonine protein kinase